MLAVIVFLLVIHFPFFYVLYVLKKMCLWYMQNVKSLFKKLVWGGMKLKKQKAPCDLIIQTQYMFLLLKCPCSHTCLFFIAAVLTNAALCLLLILQPIFNIISYFYIVFITGMIMAALHSIVLMFHTELSQVGHLDCFQFF